MKKMSIFLGALICSMNTHAANEKWTFGLGVGSQMLADYRGSSYYHAQVLPIPFVLYRGDILKIDRDGARGDFWHNDDVEFSVSADAALNGVSDDNPLREGMPELDSAIEIGPSINVRLSGPDFNSGWSLRFPLRTIYTVSSDGVDHIGYMFSPKLTWKQRVDRDQWQTTFNIGPLFASADYHQYYYGIDPVFATASRAAYEASGGYSGSFAKLSVRKQWGQWWFGAYARYDYLKGATFLDSPLVEENDAGNLGVALIRILDL